QRLRERHERRIVGPRCGRARRLGRWIGWAAGAPRDRLQQLLGAPALGVCAEPTDALEIAARGGLAPGDLHERGVAEDTLDGSILALGGLLAPLHELARDRARRGVQAVSPRQSGEDRGRVALIARESERLALLARPPQTAEALQAALELACQLEQVHDVLAGIGELLGQERACVPACEARGLGHLQAEGLG